MPVELIALNVIVKVCDWEAPNILTYSTDGSGGEEQLLFSRTFSKN